MGAEVALALVLLAGAGLLIRTFQNLRSIDPGFNARNVLSVSLAMGASTHADPERRAEFYRDALERLRSLPGVRYASAVNHVPLAGDVFTLHVTVEGRPAPSPADVPGAVYRVAMPGYFRAMGMMLRAGRGFDESDREGAPRVAVINATMAVATLAGGQCAWEAFSNR